MTLKQVLEGVPVLGAPPPGEVLERTVRGLAYDSRKVEEGYVFFAFSGAKTDGAQFAASAFAKGAIATISDRSKPAGVTGPWITVEQGRPALALASRNFYAAPDRRVSLTGITGTNGKTTTTSLIDAILRSAGKTTALIGTIEYRLGSDVLPAVNTTPESLDLFRIFARLSELGGTHATLEASSHALELGRIWAMHFHTAGFTNFTRDHLDFHQTMEAYLAAKTLLFRPSAAPAPRFAIFNADDPACRGLQPAPESEVIWYGLHQAPPDGARGTWVRAENVQSTLAGLRFEVHSESGRFRVESPLMGEINAYNILLASAATLTYGLTPDQIVKGIGTVERVPGRFERVEEGQPFAVIVDYAHTDDALRNVIQVARGLRPQRILTVFGCGGDRDRSKRPLMGMAAAEASDLVVLTSDNPRSEDPLSIMNDAMVGLQRFDTPCVAEPDRERAIRKALEAARPGDVVILAGKGHETYQILKDGPIPFDDREVARRVLRSLGWAAPQLQLANR